MATWWELSQWGKPETPDERAKKVAERLGVRLDRETNGWPLCNVSVVWAALLAAEEREEKLRSRFKVEFDRYSETEWAANIVLDDELLALMPCDSAEEAHEAVATAKAALDKALLS